MKRLVGAVILLSVCVGLQAQTLLTSSRPVAERAAIRLLDPARATRNAILYVQFARTPQAPGVLTLAEEQATLRDDGEAPDQKAGDGIHSAYLHVNVDELRKRQARMLSARSLPLFVGRELVGHATATLSTRPLALKDLPVIPNAANFVRNKDGKAITLALRFTPIRAGTLIPIYPTLLTVSEALPDVKMANDRSLIVTGSLLQDPDRTDDPCSAVGRSGWTFGHLMRELAEKTTISAPRFVERWLDTWASTQTINTFAVPPRTQMADNIVRNWPRIGTELDLDRSPFVLVAIVNRIDLGEDDPFGPNDRDDSAGEARFIFAATGRINPADPCSALPIMVIFEYKVNITGCTNVKQWAQQWGDLERPFISDASFASALKAITVQFTEAGTNPSQKPHESSLAQIRTNIFMVERPLTEWEQREFRIPSLSFPWPDFGYLYQDTVAQTPDISHNNTSLLTAYALSARIAILHDKHTIPLTLSTGTPFLAGAAPVPGDGGGQNAKPEFFWDGPGPAPNATLARTPDLRHKLSLATCNGCHGDETNAVFTHVSEKGALSTFLTGGSVKDPAGEKLGGLLVKRSFNDLERRRQRMEALLAEPCWGAFFRAPLLHPH